MSQHNSFESFYKNYDDYTRNLARLVASFFRQEKTKLIAPENLVLEFKNYLLEQSFLQLQDLKIELKTIEGGYSGYISTASLKRPLFFEITLT